MLTESNKQVKIENVKTIRKTMEEDNTNILNKSDMKNQNYIQIIPNIRNTNHH